MKLHVLTTLATNPDGSKDLSGKAFGRLADHVTKTTGTDEDYSSQVTQIAWAGARAMDEAELTQDWLNFLSPAFIQAAKIASARGALYNSDTSPREAHFPFGITSYSQMIHMKSMRLISIIKNGGDPKDTLLDLINYAAFAYEHIEKDGDRESAPY